MLTSTTLPPLGPTMPINCQLLRDDLEKRSDYEQIIQKCAASDVSLPVLLSTMQSEAEKICGVLARKIVKGKQHIEDKEVWRVSDLYRRKKQWHRRCVDPVTKKKLKKTIEPFAK